MIPIQLTLRGIYSYRDEQTIDFTSLSKNHLFGIFGPVGSGKSTILEAMTFALFGETDRLNSKNDLRNYNMMNLKSDELFIDFAFVAGHDHSDLYRFTVRAKRNRKSFEDVGKYERRAFKKEDDTWVPIEPDKVEEIIGLSYSNFCRTIIIPQGKFAEFLQLGDSDRSEMLKDIFSLDRFDLYSKADLVDKKNNEELQGVKGQLQQIGDVTKQKIEADEQRLQGLSGNRKNLDAKLREEEKNEKAFEELRKLQVKITDQTAAVDLLQKREPEYLKKEKQVEEFETCSREFRDILNKFKDQERRLAEQNRRITENRKKETKLAENVTEKQATFESVKAKYDDRADLETQWEEHESLLHVLQLDSEIESLSEQEQQSVKGAEGLKEKSSNLKSELEKTNHLLKELKQSLPDETALVEMSKWFTKRQGMLDQIREHEQAIKDARSKLKTLSDDKDNLIAADDLSRFLKASDLSLPAGKLVEKLQSIKKDLRTTIRDAQKSIDSLQATAGLETFARELADGEPCPLCGSEHHPKAYHAKGVKSRISELDEQKHDLEAQIEVIDQALSELGKLGGTIEAAELEFAKAEKNKKSKEGALVQHDETFRWKGFSLADQKKVEKELESGKKLKEKIEAEENTRAELEETREKANEDLSKLHDQLQIVKQNLAAKKSERRVILGKVKHVDADPVLRFGPKEIKMRIEKLHKQYSNVERQYEINQRQLDDARDELNRLRGEITNEEQSLQTRSREVKDTDGELNHRLKEHKYNDMAEVKRILSLEMDVRAERKAIQKFREDLQSAKEQLVSLTSEKGGRSYSQSKHQESKARVAQLRVELENLDKEIGSLESTIHENVAKLKNREKLESDRLKLEGRASNLKVFKNLFRGRGFVNYVSRVYLTNLCGAANERFAQLTKQRLRLDLTDTNSFQVRDYLNDGKLRNVKTLSGGQTFQASLSLALALADNIQHFAQSSQSFFFLDEGFGSLDKDSLQIVFDALKSLRHENRIVGVISHVEDMKQEIENYISVELHEGQGSLIIVN